jgi:cyclin H
MRCAPRHHPPQELDALRSQQSAALDPQLLGAPSEALGAAHAKARSALDLLQLSDAPLLHPPGVLAVAALRSGFRGVQLPCQRYLQHVAACGAAAAAAGGIGEAAGAPAEQQQQQQPAPVPDAVVQAHHEQLLATLAALDGLAAGLQGQLDEGALQARATGVDRAIKLWKKELGGGGAGGAAGNATAAAGSDGAGGAGQGQGVVPSQQQQQAVAAG